MSSRLSIVMLGNATSECFAILEDSLAAPRFIISGPTQKNKVSHRPFKHDNDKHLSVAAFGGNLIKRALWRPKGLWETTRVGAKERGLRKAQRKEPARLRGSGERKSYGHNVIPNCLIIVSM